jgi:hypothetical protein
MDGAMEETGESGGCISERDCALEVCEIDIQRLLLWYFDVEHPGRAHITSRGRHDPILT